MSAAWIALNNCFSPFILNLRAVTWMLQFGARVVDAELPVDPGLFAIALLGLGPPFPT